MDNDTGSIVRDDNHENRDQVCYQVCLRNLNTNNLSSIFSFLDKRTLTKTVPYVSKQWNKAFNDIAVHKRLGKLVFDGKDDIFILFVKKVWKEISFCRDWIAHEIAINRIYGSRFVHKTKKLKTKSPHKGIFINNAIFDRLLSGDYALKNILKCDNLSDDYRQMKDINELLSLYKTLYEPSIEYNDIIDAKVKTLCKDVFNLVVKIQIPTLRRIYFITAYLIRQSIELMQNNFWLNDDFYLNLTMGDSEWISCLNEPTEKPCPLCSSDGQKRTIIIYNPKSIKCDDILILNVSTLKTLCPTCTECICEYSIHNTPKQNLRVFADKFNNICINETSVASTPNLLRPLPTFLRPDLPFNYFNIIDQVDNRQFISTTIIRDKYTNVLELLISKYQNIFLKQNSHLKSKNTSIINLCMNDINGFQDQCKEYYNRSKMNLDNSIDSSDDVDIYYMEESQDEYGNSCDDCNDISDDN
jgi:hypothetical protein